MTPPSDRPPSSELATKVPQITLAFWVIKILATTLGETGGDAVTMGLDLGLANGETWTLRARAVGRPWVYRGGGYDGGFSDGKGQGAPIDKDLDTFPVRVEGDNILVEIP